MSNRVRSKGHFLETGLKQFFHHLFFITTAEIGGAKDSSSWPVARLANWQLLAGQARPLSFLSGTTDHSVHGVAAGVGRVPAKTLRLVRSARPQRLRPISKAPRVANARTPVGTALAVYRLKPIGGPCRRVSTRANRGRPGGGSLCPGPRPRPSSTAFIARK